MAAFFVDISRDFPARYLIVSTIFLNITYFFYIVAFLWAFLSWYPRSHNMVRVLLIYLIRVQTARRLLLEDPASHTNRNLRLILKIMTWVTGLMLLAGVIII